MSVWAALHASVSASAILAAMPRVIARYWRVLFHGSFGDTRVGVGEIEFRVDKGIAARHSMSSVAASSTFTGQFATRAVDQNVSLGWLATGNVGEWFRVDLGASGAGQVVEIGMSASATNAAAQSPSGFDVQWSNDLTTWTTDWSVSNIAPWSNGETRIFSLARLLGDKIEIGAASVVAIVAQGPDRLGVPSHRLLTIAGSDKDRMGLPRATQFIIVRTT